MKLTISEVQYAIVFWIGLVIGYMHAYIHFILLKTIQSVGKNTSGLRELDEKVHRTLATAHDHKLMLNKRTLNRGVNKIKSTNVENRPVIP